MKIIIVGCGKIGATIVGSLVAEGHDIVVVDDNPDVLSTITTVYDVMGVCGNGADYDILSEAGAESTDLLVSVTASDELNMLICFLARRMGVHHTIARIRNPEYNDHSLGFLRQQLDLSMSINPDLLAAQEIFDILKLPSALKIETFAGRALEIIELPLREDSGLDGMKLMELREKYHAKFLVCAVQRGEEVHIPDGNFILKTGDKIGLTASPAEVQKLLRALGVLRKQARSVMILGGSRTSYYLANLLTAAGHDVKIIEKDPEICRELCETLPKAVIINGDGAQQETLLEEGLKNMDALVALTGMDEENILLAVSAAAQNVPKVIAKVNREELVSLAGKMGLDCIVSPKKTVSDVLVRYARAWHNSKGSNVETLYKLMDDKAEALEFNVQVSSAVTDIPLKELSLKQNILIAGIVRNRKTIIPAGDDRILPGDKVIVLAANHWLQDLTDILR